ISPSVWGSGKTERPPRYRSCAELGSSPRTRSAISDRPALLEVVTRFEFPCRTTRTQRLLRRTTNRFAYLPPRLVRDAHAQSTTPPTFSISPHDTTPSPLDDL